MHSNASHRVLGAFNKMTRSTAGEKELRKHVVCAPKRTCAHRAHSWRVNERRATTKPLYIFKLRWVCTLHTPLHVPSYLLLHSLVSGRGARVPSSERKSLRVSSMNWKIAREKNYISVVEHDFSALHRLRIEVWECAFLILPQKFPSTPIFISTFSFNKKKIYSPQFLFEANTKMKKNNEWASECIWQSVEQNVSASESGIQNCAEKRPSISRLHSIAVHRADTSKGHFHLVNCIDNDATCNAKRKQKHILGANRFWWWRWYENVIPSIGIASGLSQWVQCHALFLLSLSRWW